MFLFARFSSVVPVVMTFTPSQSLKVAAVAGGSDRAGYFDVKAFGMAAPSEDTSVALPSSPLLSHSNFSIPLLYQEVSFSDSVVGYM